MTKELRKKSEILLKEIFKNNFKTYEEELKIGNLYIEECNSTCEINIISNGIGGVDTLQRFNNCKELYFYVKGLYDMKKGKFQDYIKVVKTKV